MDSQPTPQPSLEQKIEDTRITYTDNEVGVSIDGSPFICEFETQIDPEAFCEQITKTDDPWQMFGVSTKLKQEYWKVVGTLFHIEKDILTGSSQLTLEVCPDWVRVYVKENCSAERVTKFVKNLDDEYGIETSFPQE